MFESKHRDICFKGIMYLGLKYINPCFNYKFITSCSKFSLLPFARFFIRLR